MAEKNNAVCSICGKPYYVCLSCSDAIKLHPYKNFTDTAEHFKVFQVVKGFSTGVYTKEEAREKFKNVDLKDIDSFRPHIKKIVKNIIKEDKTVVEDIKKVKVEETEILENVVKSTVSRKRNYKMETE